MKTKLKNILKKSKNLLLLFVISLILTPSYAQLKVLTNGHAGINIGTNPDNGTLNIYNSGTTLHSRSIYANTSILLNYGYGIYGAAHRSTPQNTGRSYGVYGIAGNSTDGYNYGVYGYLYGSNLGAAIYGTQNGDCEIVGQYAGFFNGAVKIATNLYVLGSISSPSDINLKKNIRSLGTGNLDKIKKINCIRYQLKSPEEMGIKPKGDSVNSLVKLDSNSLKIYNQERIGVVAQELQEIYPELVEKDQDGSLAVNYIELIPILIEAVKEQQTQIDKLKSASDTKLKTADNLNNSLDDLGTTLFQNKPNPFNQQTTIEFYLPSSIAQAHIYVYDLQGKQIKVYKISERGQGNIIIYANELQAGMYKYALIADGQVIGAETMILTD